MALGEGLSPEVELAAAEIVRELVGGIVPYYTSLITPP
jgi:hypothetical protein